MLDPPLRFLVNVLPVYMLLLLTVKQMEKSSSEHIVGLGSNTAAGSNTDADTLWHDSREQLLFRISK